MRGGGGRGAKSILSLLPPLSGARIMRLAKKSPPISGRKGSLPEESLQRIKGHPIF
jgi:hypothetical protein